MNQQRRTTKEMIEEERLKAKATMKAGVRKIVAMLSDAEWEKLKREEDDRREGRRSHMIFVAEVTAAEGFLFEDVAIAAIDAKDADEARDFLIPAVMAKNRQLFEAGAKRWDEGSAIVTREASPAEATAWRERRATHRDVGSAVVWLVDV